MNDELIEEYIIDEEKTDEDFIVEEVIEDDIIEEENADEEEVVWVDIIPASESTIEVPPEDIIEEEVWD